MNYAKSIVLFSTLQGANFWKWGHFHFDMMQLSEIEGDLQHQLVCDRVNLFI